MQTIPSDLFPMSFAVEGLSSVAVGNYDDIRLRMAEGEKVRTIAATKMNETSR